MHTSRPTSLSLKDYLIRRLASKLMLSEDVISAVVSHQYNSALIATKHVNEVELSGLGKFIFSKKKGRSRLNNLVNTKEVLNELTISHPEKLSYYNAKLESVNDGIEYIQTKLESDELD